MAKQKRKLTSAEKAAKERRNAEFMIIFVNGKQKRVRRPPMIDGMSVEEFIRRNADPIWLHQNEMWEYMTPEPLDDLAESIGDGGDDDIPFRDRESTVTCPTTTAPNSALQRTPTASSR